MALIVSVAAVRDYLKLESGNPTANSQYTDATISSNILAAQNNLEQATSRWFVDRPGVTFQATSMFAPIVALPGFRTFTTVTWNGVAQVTNITSSSNATVWAIPDTLQTGLYTGMSFRPLNSTRGSWYQSDPLYWDKGYDVGLASARGWGSDTSAPMDLSIVGDGGYAPNTEPYALRHAIKVWAGFYTKRPDSLLADVAITPQGGVVNYSTMPAEVSDFIKSFRAGPQMVSI